MRLTCASEKWSEGSREGTKRPKYPHNLSFLISLACNKILIMITIIIIIIIEKCIIVNSKQLTVLPYLETIVVMLGTTVPEPI